VTRNHRSALVLCLAVAAFMATRSAARTGEVDAALPSAQEILANAFVNQYEVDTTATIELIMRSSRGQERHRHFRAASKLIDERMHAIGRLVRPEYLRGMTILQIEAEDRGHDAFVYLPSLRKVRRISTSQRGDAFFGTDITYEDLERRHLRDFEIVSSQAGQFAGEDVYAIRVRPLRESTYSAAQFTVSLEDYVILEARYFKRESGEAYRVLTSLRSGVLKADGHVLPTQMRVENLSKGTITEVTFRDLKINPVIDDRVFSIRTLEQKRAIPKPEN
jgi:hypothetical protein